jgi:predicted Zn-dependent protease
MTHKRRIKRGTPAELDLDIARFAYDEGRLAEAAQQLRELQSTFPDDDNVVGTLGYVEFEMGHFDIALTLLRRATELDPLWERWSLGVVHCPWKLEKFDEALDEISLLPTKFIPTRAGFWKMQKQPHFTREIHRGQSPYQVQEMARTVKRSGSKAVLRRAVQMRGACFVAMCAKYTTPSLVPACPGRVG